MTVPQLGNEIYSRVYSQTLSNFMSSFLHSGTDPIATAREIGLSLLKPSKRDLEYGLAIHKESIVMESYSLGLHAPIDYRIVNEAVAAGLSYLQFNDMTEEMIMTNWVATKELLEEYVQAWEASGVTCISLNAGEEGNNPLRLILRFARYIGLLDELPDLLVKVTSVEDVLRAHQEGKYGICLAPNSIPLKGVQSTVSEELQYLQVFAQMGARMMHLTYNRRNLIGDGCAELANGGLSDFGQTAIREMNRLGIIIDVAHSGWQTCIDAAIASDQPIIASHTAIWELSCHCRCKSNEVIKAIVDKGGTVGITTIPRFIGGDGTILTMLNHIDYLAKNFGIDAVTIGTDNAYQSRYHSKEKSNTHPSGQNFWESFMHPKNAVYVPEWTKPEQRESMAWTNWPLFTVGLVQRGYSDEEIKKIIGGNILRVAKQVWRSPIGADKGE